MKEKTEQLKRIIDLLAECNEVCNINLLIVKDRACLSIHEGDEMEYKTAAFNPHERNESLDDMELYLATMVNSIRYGKEV